MKNENPFQLKHQYWYYNEDIQSDEQSGFGWGVADEIF